MFGIKRGCREWRFYSLHLMETQRTYIYPHNLAKNLVLYLGTHDNDTTCRWYDKADEEIRRNFDPTLMYPETVLPGTFLRFAYRICVSPLVIVPVQDLAWARF